MREQSDHAFLNTIHRLQPVTVQALCDATGVTATAIRQRLLRLQAADLVSRGVSRGSRGRPFHTYEVTPTGVRSLGDDHAELAAILWREIKKIPQEEIREQVLAGVKQALISRFHLPQTENGTLSDRLGEVCSRLTEYGFDVEVAPPAPGRELPILKERNCPYYEVAEEDPDFCEFEQSVFSELIGAPLELSACRQHGGGHCEFQVGVPSSEVRT